MSRLARTDEVKVERRRRQGSGPERNMKLHVPEKAKDPDFHYHWINNKPGRVKQLTQMDDYDIVSSTDGLIDTGTAEGTVVKRTVDRREGDEAILVRKPLKFYEADKAEEQRLLDARDEELRSGKVQGTDALSGSEAYVPGGRRGKDGRNTIAGK